MRINLKRSNPVPKLYSIKFLKEFLIFGNLTGPTDNFLYVWEPIDTRYCRLGSVGSQSVFGYRWVLRTLLLKAKIKQKYTLKKKTLCNRIRRILAMIERSDWKKGSHQNEDPQKKRTRELYKKRRYFWVIKVRIKRVLSLGHSIKMCLLLFGSVLRIFHTCTGHVFFALSLHCIICFCDERAQFAWAFMFESGEPRRPNRSLARYHLNCWARIARKPVRRKTNKVFNFDFIIYLETTWNICDLDVPDMYTDRPCVLCMFMCGSCTHYLMFNYCYVTLHLLCGDRTLRFKLNKKVITCSWSMQTY